MKAKFAFFITLAIHFSCSSPSKETATSSPKENVEDRGMIQLITLDPGHFHAALVQKNMYGQIDPVVEVYAPNGKDVRAHLEKIKQFNTRKKNPTSWVEEVYVGDDYLEKLLEEKAGNVVVLAGNNARKIKYIQALLDAGLNVLADKPIAINPEGFILLQKAFEIAQEKNIVLYDIMTERYNIMSILQKEFSQIPGLFGVLQKGTPDKPAVFKKSVHHLFKTVSGEPLTRPAWYFDTDQQGEGIIDVSTHFVDLILWGCFPEKAIAIDKTEVVRARRWATKITPAQFSKVTGLEGFPEYLHENVTADSVLNLFSNGEFVFRTNGVYGKVSVTWEFEEPEGAADTHYSIMRGTNANVIIRQDEEQGYKATLYVEPVKSATKASIEESFKEAIKHINMKYPGITYKSTRNGWEVVIPKKYKEGHEAHFTRVMKKYLNYLEEGKLPEWEKQLMLTKYYITTQAYKLSHQGQ